MFAQRAIENYFRAGDVFFSIESDNFLQHIHYIFATNTSEINFDFIKKPSVQFFALLYMFHFSGTLPGHELWKAEMVAP